MHWKFRSRPKSSEALRLRELITRAAAFGRRLVRGLSATTCHWLLPLPCSCSTELNGRYSASKSIADISVPGQEQKVISIGLETFK